VNEGMEGVERVLYVTEREDRGGNGMVW